MALVPCSPRMVPRSLSSIYEIIAWQTEQSAWTADLAERQRVLSLLFRFLSPAIRIEPGLLRHVRTLLSNAEDASLESEFWTDPRLSSNHPIAATMRKDQSVRLRMEFANLPNTGEQLRVLNAIRRWHSALKDSPEIWLEEFLSLPPHLKKLIPESDEKDARACFVQLLRDLTETNSQLQEEASTYLTRATSAMRLSEFAYRDSEVGELLDDTRLLLHPEARPKDWSDIRRIPTDRLRLFGIDISNDDSVCIRETQNILPSKSPGATFIRSQVEYLKLSDRPTDGSTGFWKTARPDFVSDFGTDQYGAWCEVRIPALSGRTESEFVPHRFRWIPAGTFLMGSPDDEPERSSDEGPQHKVTLSRGFWMAETACPQGVWKAVTGKTPSHFEGEDRPVEKVSWNDVQEFLQRVNAAVPGLGLRLPTEAQWEFACRAGTTTPFHTGFTITAEQADFDGNYPYARGAKGLYRSEPVAVRTFPPNAWGLYEMHGNVWEWCA
ncbi:MAG: formylglycine-generating enzyme family protein, partial [Planctomycetaceae bacterium]|nr:formylglycine-generating enzyme family protein [Planctomycetaceae bacterium]